MKDFFETQLLSINKENSLVSSFKIKPIPSAFSTLKSGQYLLLRIFQESIWSEAHPFTITSRLSDDFLRITVKKIGNFTTKLHSLKPPLPVLIKGPMGEFGKNIEMNKQIVFIAGGIGITPFIALLNRLNDIRSNAKIIVFWANEHIEDLFYLDLLNDFSEGLDITVVLVINKLVETIPINKYAFQWKSGYATKEILSEYIETKDSAFYMCGSENMQKYMFAQLEALRITPVMVETEKFGIYMKK